MRKISKKGQKSSGYCYIAAYVMSRLLSLVNLVLYESN